MLPKSITNLRNLQTLKLVNCVELKELPEDTWKLVNLRVLDMNGCESLTHLPEDTSKLVNLRVLDMNGCKSLTHMPAGMGNLTSLHTLPMFIVCGNDDYLIDLKPVINNLRGVLRFKEVGDDIRNNCMKVKLDSFNIEYDIDRDQKGQKKLLEFLFCNRQAWELSIVGFIGTEFGKLPSWATGLVSIELLFCKELLHLPSSLSQLCHLKKLTLDQMQSMEYIESDVDASSPYTKFFPCLEELQLITMPKLKGWWKNKTWMETEIVSIPSFPRLYKLDIMACESLTYIPQCPHLKQLGLSCVDSLLMEDFQICTSLQHLFMNKSSGIKILRKEHLTKLNFLNIRNCYPIKLLLEEICHFTSLTTLIISNSLALKSLPEAIKHLTSLTTLEIEECPELKSLPEAIKHLTSLNTLKIIVPSPELKDRCQEPDGEDWLKICHIPNIYIEDLLDHRKRISRRGKNRS